MSGPGRSRALAVRGAGPVAAAALAGLLAAVPAAGQERFRRTPPLPDAQPVELKLPAVKRAVLQNGLTVACAARAGSPEVTLQFVVRAGEADSPPGLPGLAAVTARMIGKGTRRLSAQFLEDMVESLGTELASTALMDYTVVSLRVHTDQLDRAIFVLRLIVLEAAFSERELGAVRRDVFRELQGQKKDPEVLAWRHLLRVLFEGHPYRTATYAEDVIKFITVRDVAAFYGAFFRPANAAVLVSGDIDVEIVAKKIASHFGAWEIPSLALPSVPPPAPQTRDRVCYIEAPDVAHAAVFAGNVIMNASDPDFFPFLVLKQILGGTTRSRLFMNLRESKGLAFYAFSETEFFGSCGVYWARALVRPEAIVPAAREIAREIGTLAAWPASPSEIEEAKSYLIGNLPMHFESPQGFSDWLARYVALGLDDAHWDKGQERYQKVNAEQVREAARRRLTARPLTVIVGRPEWLGPVAAEFETVEVYDTTGKLARTLRQGDSL
jgi:predicted Zn-dependent peptidase